MRYKLHLNREDLETLREILDAHDWMCDCDDWPDCSDFARFRKLKRRLGTLEERAEKAQGYGRMGYRAARRGLLAEILG